MIDDLINVPQREIAGSRSANAFDFQKDWAFAELLDYHKEDKDYIFIFEFHDDILILNSESNPTSINFCQIKTANKNWSITRLTSTENKSQSNLSILGKLFLHKLDFPDMNSQLHFISDAAFSFKNDCDKFCYTALSEDHKRQIIEKLNNELNNLENNSFNDLYFTHTHIPVEEHEVFVKGRLNEFLSIYFGEDHSIPLNNIYRTISDQIRTKNNFRANDIITIGDLLNFKCIKKSDITKFLNDLRNTHHKIKPLWSVFENRLDTFSPFEVAKIKLAWNKYAINKLDANDHLLNELSELIENELNNIDINANNFINIVKENISEFTMKYSEIFDKYYIIAIILWKSCER